VGSACARLLDGETTDPHALVTDDDDCACFEIRRELIEVF